MAIEPIRQTTNLYEKISEALKPIYLTEDEYDYLEIVIGLAKDQIVSAYKAVHKNFNDEKFKSFYDFCVKKKLLESLSDYLREVYELRCLRINKITDIMSVFYSNFKNFKKLPIFIDNQDFLLKTITEPVLGVKA